jgi:hypothetical protein
LMGGAGLVPREGEGRAALTASGEAAGPAKGAAPEVATGGPKGR